MRTLLAKNLRNLRGDISREQVSRETGISWRTIVRWEDPDDPSSPTRKNLEKIADYYKVSVDALMSPNGKRQVVDSANALTHSVASSEHRLNKHERRLQEHERRIKELEAALERKKTPSR